jgi:hypothetical protein
VTRTLPALGPVVVQSEELNFAAERIAVNSQGLGGLGLIAFVFLQDLLDEPLLKLTDGIGVENFAVNHLNNECIKHVFHGSAPVDQNSIIAS